MLLLPPTLSAGRTYHLSGMCCNFGRRRLVLPKRIKRWSLTSLQQHLVKTGGRLVKHARYYWLLLAVAGGESSDPTPVRVDAPTDLGAPGADRLTGENRRGPSRETCPRNAMELCRFRHVRP